MTIVKTNEYLSEEINIDRAINKAVEKMDEDQVRNFVCIQLKDRYHFCGIKEKESLLKDGTVLLSWSERMIWEK